MAKDESERFCPIQTAGWISSADSLMTDKVPCTKKCAIWDEKRGKCGLRQVF